jgi:hypothetical protein
MKKHFVKYFLLVICLGLFVNAAEAQKKGRTAVKRTTTKKTAKTKTKAKIKPTTATVDTVAKAVVVAAHLCLMKIYVQMMHYFAIKYGVK